MEQQCKRSGLRFTSRDGEDRINELPEALLLHILSKVSTEIAIATSVLSKQWRSLWKMVPKLKFDSHYHQSSSSENIYKSLILHKAPFLESLHIKVDYKPDAVDIAAWIGIAFARRVRELVLDVDLGKLKFVDFPGVLFSYNDTLEVLKLKNCILLDFPSRVCFKSLRVLHLWFVHFQDFDRVSISNFFSGCPCLEDLFVKRISKWDVDMFIIDVLPSLRRLTLDDDYEPNEWDRGYMINVPSLKYLHIKGLKDLDYCKIENALEELVEASIVNVSDITKENILASLTSAKHLTLHISPLKVKYPIGSIFYRLVSLELRTNDEEWWNLLSLMLVGSPKLQILKLVDESYYREKGTVDRRWNQPLCVPECLLMHLETFVWTRYEWGRKDEKEVATYILNNARRLKKATLSTKPIRSKEKLEMRCEMLKELASEVSVSSSCQLVLESDTYI